jgi:glutamate 5-kinase
MPSRALRQSVLASARRVVVKLGTQVLTAPDGRLDQAFLDDVARQVVALRQRGVQVTMVSSGAIGAGCGILGLPARPKDVAEQQAVAAVGQRQLMNRMHEAFAPHGVEVGQVLLTRGDFDDRGRFLNIRNCIGHLHALGCVPIINENDTVAVEELAFGDNDTLAALICNALPADALVLLTVVPGLLDGEGKLVELVENVAQMMALARNEKSPWGKGGFRSKLEAARLVTEAGEIAVIAHGREPDVLGRLFAAEPIGTVFVPASRKLDSRRRWIGLTQRPAGSVTIDDGAVGAVTKRGKSLLASGIVSVAGEFGRGDVLSVRDAAGREVARGLSNYSSAEVERIRGKRSSQFERILGHAAHAEVVHRDNLVTID